MILVLALCSVKYSLVFGRIEVFDILLLPIDVSGKDVIHLHLEALHRDLGSEQVLPHLVPQKELLISVVNKLYLTSLEVVMDLKNLFRSVSMVVPDAVFITEILLFSSGFKNAQELSKRVCSVQNLANVLMQQASVVKFDFGLRAIKGIIGIAEQLKQ